MCCCAPGEAPRSRLLNIRLLRIHFCPSFSLFRAVCCIQSCGNCSKPTPCFSCRRKRRTEAEEEEKRQAQLRAAAAAAAAAQLAKDKAAGGRLTATAPLIKVMKAGERPAADGTALKKPKTNGADATAAGSQPAAAPAAAAAADKATTSGAGLLGLLAYSDDDDSDAGGAASPSPAAGPAKAGGQPAAAQRSTGSTGTAGGKATIKAVLPSAAELLGGLSPAGGAVTSPSEAGSGPGIAATSTVGSGAAQLVDGSDSDSASD